MTLAVAVAAAVVAGAAGTTLAYWLTHQDHVDHAALRHYSVEVVPSRPGPYQLYLPIPVDARGEPLRGFGLHTLAGAAELGLARTDKGVALSVRGEGPLRLGTEGPLPLRLSLDDERFSFRQFKFWSYLGRSAPGEVLVKLEVRDRQHAEGWEEHLDQATAIVVQQALEPGGWQVVRATQMFDVSLREGAGTGFPRLVLGAVAVSAAAMYVPLGMALLGSVGQPGSRGRDGLK